VNYNGISDPGYKYLNVFNDCPNLKRVNVSYYFKRSEFCNKPVSKAQIPEGNKTRSNSHSNGFGNFCNNSCGCCYSNYLLL
jgi:hypothetical protein